MNFNETFRYARKKYLKKTLNNLLGTFMISFRLVRIWVYTFVTF